MGRARQFWVLAHRWAGLSLAFFLVLCGTTGSLLAFHHELDRLIAPEFFTARTGETIDPLTLRDRAERLSGAAVNHLPLHFDPGSSVIFSVEPGPGGRDPGFDEIALDPVTGAETGRRSWGDIGEGRVNVMAFIYRLHYSLALDEWGTWLLGVAALVWTIDCFVGFYLTLPVSRHGWPGRWRRAWAVRRTSPAKAEFDLHRAGGLWLWPVLLLFAWSSVGFNLYAPVFSPAMSAMLGDADSGYVEQPALARPRAEPRLDWPAAVRQARALVQAEAARRDFTVTQETFMRYDPASGVYYLGFRSDRDVYERFAGGRLAFDGDTGAMRYISLPTGEHPRTTVETWLFGLHMAAIGGLPVRIAVAAIGLLVTGLSVTGIMIWMRRRRARILRGHLRAGGGAGSHDAGELAGMAYQVQQRAEA